MNQLLKYVAPGFLGLVASSTASAHPGHSHAADASKGADDTPVSVLEHLWRGASGSFQERGSFVMARDGLVQIRRSDDSLVTLPVHLLDRASQDRINARTAMIRRAAFAIELPALPPESPTEDKSAALGSQKPPPDRAAEFLLAQLQTRKQQARGRNRPEPEIARAFETFAKLKAINTYWDERFFYVESRGIPDHRMMVGITSWQQQVPIPQNYKGDNAWRIPLHPVPARNPRTANGNFLRGAIAVAVNGIPIFNPLNNRGEDAYLFGELDEFGGHCGRADDYHYHIAPLHLEKTNGAEKPIAYALDGYPILGYTEADGSPAEGLDRFNGHEDRHGSYHYHASPKYPYINGGFHGEVTERDGQVDPQPRAEPIRPDLRPLHGAKITDFKTEAPDRYVLTYSLGERKGTVSYAAAANGSAKFEFVDPDGTTRTQTYGPRRGGIDRPPPRGKRPPPPPGE
jgi:hypothetical protein